ncbi:MAG: spore germination protein [Merdibacter sp.]
MDAAGALLYADRGSAYLDVFWQLLLLEIGIDAIKLASLNTPSSLSGSFSIIGALILGDFAIKAGWFDAEILLYMAFVALANFTQPSYEMSYAIKLFRMCMLVLIALFPLGTARFSGAAGAGAEGTGQGLSRTADPLSAQTVGPPVVSLFNTSFTKERPSPEHLGHFPYFFV